MEQAIFGMGCFWAPSGCSGHCLACYSTAVGYAGGITPNLTHYEACSGRTGHVDRPLVVYDPTVTTYERCSRPSSRATTPRRACAKGNDVGTQYRSAI